MEFLENKYLLIALTFGVFALFKSLQVKTGRVLLNPILLTMITLIVFLKMTGISYETYREGGQLIDFWLKPAIVALGVPLYLQLEMIKKQWLPILLTMITLIVFLKMTGISYDTYREGGLLIDFWLKPAIVALGVPLYLQLEMIKKQWLPILLSQLVGCLVGIISVVLISRGLDASQEVLCSLAPKSVTSPIAMEVAAATGGIPSLSAAVVILVGLFGAVLGFKVLDLGQVKSPIAQGLSMGTASHAIGTSAAMEVSKKYGAYSSLGLTLNGILTALLAPVMLRLLGIL